MADRSITIAEPTIDSDLTFCVRGGSVRTVELSYALGGLGFNKEWKFADLPATVRNDIRDAVTALLTAAKPGWGF